MVDMIVKAINVHVPGFHSPALTLLSNSATLRWDVLGTLLDVPLVLVVLGVVLVGALNVYSKAPTSPPDPGLIQLDNRKSKVEQYL